MIALVLIGGGPVDGQTPPPNLPGIAPNAVASSLVSYADASSEPCTTACWDNENNGVCEAGQHRAWVDDHNSHRKAIQVTGCDGRIIAHLPVTGDGVTASDQGLP